MVNFNLSLSYVTDTKRSDLKRPIENRANDRPCPLHALTIANRYKKWAHIIVLNYW